MMKKSNKKIEKKIETPKLTPKQLKFCEAYLKTGNGTQSYKDAGYKVSNDKVAEANARKLLANRGVKAYVTKLMDDLRKPEIASADEVLQYLTRGMRGQIEEEVVTTIGSGNGYSKVTKVKKQISAKDANKCAELLAKRYALLTDRQEINATVSVPQIVADIPDGEDDVDE